MDKMNPWCRRCGSDDDVSVFHADEGYGETGLLPRSKTVKLCGSCRAEVWFALAAIIANQPVTVEPAEVRAHRDDPEPDPAEFHADWGERPRFAVGDHVVMIEGRTDPRLFGAKRHDPTKYAGVVYKVVITISNSLRRNSEGWPEWSEGPLTKGGEEDFWTYVLDSESPHPKHGDLRRFGPFTAYNLRAAD